MKDYKQNNCADKLQKFSLSELEKYAKYIDQLMLNDPTNHKLFEYVENLYKLWISKDNDNETAYHMYLDILRLTNHYYEAYSICKKLIEEKKFKSMVYKQLSDFGYEKSRLCLIGGCPRVASLLLRGDIQLSLPAAFCHACPMSRGAYHVARVYYFYFKLPPFQKVVCRQA